MSSAVAVAALLGASGVVNAYSGWKQSSAEKKTLEAAQDQAVANAATVQSVAEKNAHSAELATRSKLRVQKLQNEAAEGKARLAFGASGTTGGTTIQALADQAAADTMNMETTAYEGKVQAENIRNEGALSAASWKQQANYYGAQAKNIGNQRYLQLFGNLLSGGSSAYAGYAMVKK